MKPTVALLNEYQRLFDSCTINARQEHLVEQSCIRSIENKSRYEAVATEIACPWYFIACIHTLEASQDFKKHLHNGDSLQRQTRNVPKGRPPGKKGPFSWEESAIDALELKNLHKWDNWSVSGMLYLFEDYNGWGYRMYHPHVYSPYLWSGSCHYIRGKYTADGRWSETAVSRQLGAALLLRRYAEIDAIELHHAPSYYASASTTAKKPVLKYNPRKYAKEAEDLQHFLNTLPGIYVKIDGYAGKKTSDAFKACCGHYLLGDPRIA